MEICFSFSVVIILFLFPQRLSTPHLDSNFFNQFIGRQTLLYGHRWYIDRLFKVCASLTNSKCRNIDFDNKSQEKFGHFNQKSANFLKRSV